MPHVQFTRHLRVHFPALADAQVRGETVAEVVAELDSLHPGMASYLVDDHGALRRHVNIFVNDELVRDRVRLKDPVRPGDRVYVMQALSGG
jgi:molybdopterin converting factor small subunit